MGDPKTDRVQLMMSPAEIAAIDDWMFAQRIRSRAEAMRRLIQTGLSVETDIAESDRRLAALGLGAATQS